MVDVTRDARWAVSWGAARIRSWGGDRAARCAAIRRQLRRARQDAATVKHFAAYGAPVAGREYNGDMSTSSCSTTTAAYKAAVDAACHVMSSFNSLNGSPHRHPYTLQTICVTSGASVAPSSATTRRCRSSSVRLRVRSGAGRGSRSPRVDIEMRSPSPASTPPTPTRPATAGHHQITMRQLDTRCATCLRSSTGGPVPASYTDPSRVLTAELTPATWPRRTSADRSMVLLNDTNHALPLSSTESVAVVGPSPATVDQLGPTSDRLSE